MAQIGRSLALRQAVAEVVDRAKDQRRRAAVARIAGERSRLGGPFLVPVVEALQRVDRKNAHAGGLGLLADALRRRAVADRPARKIVADLDLIESERSGELHEPRE